MERCDILIVGAGAAGIAAARAAAEAGCKHILLADRKARMGGVLPQCAHRGFGRELTGPEYTEALLSGFPGNIRWCPNTSVLSVTENQTALLSGPAFGIREVSFRQMILTTGCREIPMGALPIAGTRPKGVYTAGQMQELVNLHGFVPRGPTVILGSGDLGLIMAGHLAGLGLSVTLVEQRESCGGMARNQRCLEQYPIRLLCSVTVSEVFGEKELEGVLLSDGTYLPCKTFLIAAGLRPDRELIFGLGQPDWLHICGNCRTVHPMVEAVVNEGRQAGIAAWEKIRGKL